jgi:septum formation protein
VVRRKRARRGPVSACPKPQRREATSLVLASGSPRRARILESLGVVFETLVPRVDEQILVGEGAEAAAERLARVKARAVAVTTTRPVLAADTVVVLGRRILGKPRSRRAAVAMLRLLSGRVHAVVTGVCLVARGRAFSGVERTSVHFARLTPAEARWYARTGEPMDKAGAYHVDGIGALFVRRISGSPSNVEGLPVTLVWALARRAGIRLGPL